MLFKVPNKSLVENAERTYLTVAASSGDTSLTVQAVDDNAWADDDYIIVGEIGTKNAELMQVDGSVSDGTSLSIDKLGSGSLRYDHSVGEPVYRIRFNRIEFSHSTTDDPGNASVLATVEIQPDDEFTRYDDTSNSTGWGFVRFNNEDNSTFSKYSDGVNYSQSGDGSSRDPRTLFQMRRKVRIALNEMDDNKLLDDEIDEAINDTIRSIAHERLWSFFEVERSFSSVADQFAYDIPATVHKIYSTRFDTQPLVPVNKAEWDLKHWDTDSSSADPWAACVWNRQLLVYPRPSTSASTTALDGAINSSDTTITVDSTSDFKRGDYYRFIINDEVIYATDSTSTTFTGCLRGREGTTAAAHSNNDTVTERNIVYNGHVEPTDLIDTQDRTPVPEPEVVVFGTAMRLALVLEKQTLHDRLKLDFEGALKNLKEKYSSKQTAYFGRVKDASEVNSNITGRFDPNRYPTNITGT